MVPVSIVGEEGITCEERAKTFSFVGSFSYAGSKSSAGDAGESVVS
jgi:hypothetical protein